MVKTFEEPSMPFVAFMDTDWIQKISIKGRVPEGCSRFTIYLQNGSGPEPHEIAFVLDFRMCYGNDVRTIVTNHKREGAWQAEERGASGFPLYEGEDFKIKIIVDEESFIVKVNGELMLDYQQRLSCKTINCLRIDNDVELLKVKLE